jgi:protein O-GlcNAc transferase
VIKLGRPCTTAASNNKSASALHNSLLQGVGTITQLRLEGAALRPDAVGIAAYNATTRRAMNATGQSPQDMLNEALRHLQSGNPASAEPLLRSLLPDNRRNAGFRQLMAIVASRLGRPDEALEHCSAAAEIEPANSEAHYNLGTLHLDARRFDEAAACFEKARSLRPGHYDTLNNLGLCHLRMRRLDAAEEVLRRATSFSPKSPGAHHNLGLVLQASGKLEAALDSFAAALSNGSSHAPDIHFHMGQCLYGLDRMPTATVYLQKSLEDRPDSLETLALAAAVSCRLGQNELALTQYERALQLAPDDPVLLNEYAHVRRLLCDWRDIDDITARGGAAWAAKPTYIDPMLMLSLRDDPAMHLACARIAADTVARGIARLPPRAAMARDKIRIAYVSADFRTHPVPQLMVGLFEHHDRTRFETFAVSLCADDASPLRQRLNAAFDHVIPADGLPPEQVAGLLRDKEIDIAVDLMGYGRGHAAPAFAMRPAPIQVAYMGFPGTIGADWIDYILLDAFLARDRSAHYAENIVELPGTYLVTDDRRAMPSTTADRAELREANGLPTDGFVFCCMNASYKLTPQVFDIWMRLLQAKPGSVLWLLAHGDPVDSNLKREASSRGVDPTRLVFAPRVPNEAHIARLTAADLALDTLPYGAHTTASDALWAGVPMVTCCGDSFVARVGGSLLHAMKLDELVTETLADYESLAGRLAHETDKLGELRDHIAGARKTSTLFDTALATRNFERAYEEMVRRWIAGESPRPFVVAPET